MNESIVEKIKLFGKDYIYIGDDCGGAITTKEQYENFETNFAHLCPDGIIRSFGFPIGTVDDIEFLSMENSHLKFRVYGINLTPMSMNTRIEIRFYLRGFDYTEIITATEDCLREFHKNVSFKLIVGKEEYTTVVKVDNGDIFKYSQSVIIRRTVNKAIEQLSGKCESLKTFSDWKKFEKLAYMCAD